MPGSPSGTTRACFSPQERAVKGHAGARGAFTSPACSYRAVLQVGIPRPGYKPRCGNVPSTAATLLNALAAKRACLWEFPGYFASLWDKSWGDLPEGALSRILHAESGSRALLLVISPVASLLVSAILFFSLIPEGLSVKLCYRTALHQNPSQPREWHAKA